MCKQCRPLSNAIFCGIWSESALFGYYRMYEWRAKAHMIVCACAGWFEFAHFEHVWRHFLASHYPYGVFLRRGEWKYVQTVMVHLPRSLPCRYTVKKMEREGCEDVFRFWAILGPGFFLNIPHLQAPPSQKQMAIPQWLKVAIYEWSSKTLQLAIKVLSPVGNLTLESLRVSNHEIFKHLLWSNSPSS